MTAIIEGLGVVAILLSPILPMIFVMYLIRALGKQGKGEKWELDAFIAGIAATVMYLTLIHILTYY